MKRLLLLIAVFGLLTVSCEGPQGPPGFSGPQGPPGEDGGIFTAISFEPAPITFNADNDWFVNQLYPDNIGSLIGDEVVLVYIKWINPVDGDPIWRQLPQTQFFEDGSQLVYNFDFTIFDISFFLEGTVDLASLGPDFTDNQEFRVIIVPAEPLNGIDTSDINNILALDNLIWKN